MLPKSSHRNPIVTLGFFAFLVATGAARPPEAPAEAIQKDTPAQNYDLLCSNCHGKELEGGKGGTLLGPLKHGDGAAILAKAIREGFPNTGMPAVGSNLSEHDLQALVVHIQEQRSKRVVPGPAAPLDEKLVRKSEKHAYRIESIVNDGLQVPWSFDWLPDGRILLTERIGRLRVIENGHLLPDSIAGIPEVIEAGEGGLMAVAVHPDYSHTGWIYLTFSDPGKPAFAMTKIVRGKLRDNEFVDQETIFSIPKEEYPEGYVLYGSRIQFDGDYLFFSVGDRKVDGAAQSLAKPHGKVHRTFHDGSVPPDNPFANQEGAVGSIWSIGHRNPQGLAFNPNTHTLWETEHGPRGGDELNHIERGKNYGWPIVTYGINYDGSAVSDKTSAPGMEQPARHWTPSIAVSAAGFYTGEQFPEWKNNLFVGSLAMQKLLRFEVQEGEILHEEEVFSHLGRVRDIKTGPDGLLYIALEQIGMASGWLVKLVPIIAD